VEGVDPVTAADALDSLHAFELVAALWCHAVEQRLAGPAVYLLPDELEEQAKESVANSRRLAKRIAQLGGAPRCHPAELLRLVDGKDVVTARLVERILADKVAREDEMEASLGTDQMSS
jgi:bacterioferritin (cytochrome b1)